MYAADDVDNVVEVGQDVDDGSDPGELVTARVMSAQQCRPSTVSLQQYNGVVDVIVVVGIDVTLLLLPLTSLHPGESPEKEFVQYIIQSDRSQLDGIASDGHLRQHVTAFNRLYATTVRNILCLPLWLPLFLGSVILCFVCWLFLLGCQLKWLTGKTGLRCPLMR